MTERPAAGEFGEEPEVPVEDWIPHPVSDSADYLDREPPTYLEDDEEVEEVEEE